MLLYSSRMSIILALKLIVFVFKKSQKFKIRSVKPIVT